MSNPRQIAAIALLKIETDKAYSNITLNSLLSDSDLSQLDKALCTSIFYGVLERKITLDYILKKFINSPLSKIKPYTLSVLRAAVYQIMYMDKIPDSAAVNESVKLIKKSKESYNSSFINGVLRNILRNDISLPDGNDINSISIKFSCPAKIVSLLIKDYGIDTTKLFLESSISAPPTFLRVNTLKTNKEYLLKAFDISDALPNDINTIRINNVGSLENLQDFNDGLFYVQDLSCQRAIEKLDITENSRVLDICAAPGGKTFTAAQYANSGEVISCDLYPQRVNLIKQGAARLGLNNVKTFVGNATLYNNNLGTFDRIICDVPCSGLGVIRRKPDIKYKNIDDFSQLVEIQKKILSNSIKYLSDNGKLLYSTCTLNCAENREVVDYILASNKDLKLIYEHTFFPHIDGGDGFYAAIIAKQEW